MRVVHQPWKIASQGPNPKSYTLQGQCYKCLAMVSVNVDNLSVMRALLNNSRRLKIKCETCQESLEIHKVECFSEALIDFVGVKIER